MKKLYLTLTIMLILNLVYAQASDWAKKSADEAYEALMKNHWEAARCNFTGDFNYWFYAHSLDIATMALARNPSAINRGRLEKMYECQKKRGFLQKQDVYFDDEAWMAISLAKMTELTGDQKYLKDAQILMDDILTRGRIGRARGVWWNFEHQKVATASNAGPVIAAVVIWRQTQQQKYLDFAKENYAYWRSEMVDPVTFQIYDQILDSGEIDRTSFSYDQGLMIGAAVELFKVSKDSTYLADARNFSSYMLKRMSSASGVMVEELCVKRLEECQGWKDVAQFKGIGFRYMVELLKVDPSNMSVRTYLQTTAESIMSPAAFDPASGKFAFEWDGSTEPSRGYYQTANSAALAIGAFGSLP